MSPSPIGGGDSGVGAEMRIELINARTNSAIPG